MAVEGERQLQDMDREALEGENLIDVVDEVIEEEA